jgi:hypothetical protein
VACRAHRQVTVGIDRRLGLRPAGGRHTELVAQHRNALIVAAVMTWIPGVLLLDHGWSGHGASVDQQRLLGVGTWLLLLGLLARERIRIRIQIAVVVAFATVIEYAFSYELHVYVYRLHNVPWFVPPGHGLVYLGALSVGRSPAVVRRARVLVPATLVVSGSYAVWGLFISSRQDLLGMLWFGCLAAFLLRGRQPTVFVGAFMVVTYLELVGTHLGTWTWQMKDPIAHVISMGNPPSGAAGGYGFFDALALAAAPRIDAALSRWLVGGARSGRADPAEDLVVQQAVAGQQVAAVGAGDA